MINIHGEREFDALLEQSRDLHSAAMATTKEALDELVEVGRDRRDRPDEIDADASLVFAESSEHAVRRGLAAGGVVASAAFGAALLGLTKSAAFASAPADVQMLQTSASIENLAVSTYKTALTLPYIGGRSANPVIKAFATTTMSQHSQHAQAFNAAVRNLGGKAQKRPDPKYVPVVQAAVATIAKQSPSAGALAAVGLAITLENVAAETYVANCPLYTDINSRRITASIMGVEAQHVATLLAVRALLEAGAPELITLSPTIAAKLPAAAGAVGFPSAFYQSAMASPATEGAVS